MKSISFGDFNRLALMTSVTQPLVSKVDVFYLIYTSNLIAVKQSVKNKEVSVHHRNEKGETLLHYAILYNQIKIAEELITLGASLNAVDNAGNSVSDIIKLDYPDAQHLLFVPSLLTSTKGSLFEAEGQQYENQDVDSLGCIKNNCEIF